MNSARSVRSRIWWAGVVLCALVCSAYPARENRLAPARIRVIEQAISAEMWRWHIPGLSVAVARDLQLAWSGGFGMADLENSVPARAATMYRLGSISKPITAVAVLQLAERDKLDLDAPIQKYVPSFPEKPWPVTARELLGHTAGIRHYRSAEELDSTRHYIDIEQPLEIFAADPLVFEPGAKFSYSTYGYNLLGAAVEGASGAGFVSYLRAHIFVPAGMDHIRPDNVYAIIPNRARGYRRSRAGVENCSLADTSNKIPGGGLVSTPEDLVKLVLALERGVLLKKRTVEQMLTTQKTSDGNPTPYGLGWYVRESGGKKWVSHSGSQQGISTFLLTVPSDGRAVALMANLEGVRLEPLAVRIAALLVK